MNKVRYAFKKHRILIGIYLFVLLYQFAIVNNGSFFHVNGTTYMFYSVDYSMGFCSRILPGAIYHFLVNVYNQKAVSIYLTVFYLAFLLIIAYFLEKFINAFPQDQKTCFILVLLFLTGPFTIQMFVKEFGMLDFHWAFLFLLSCLLLQNKYLRYLIPVFVACMVMVHYGSLICYVAALLLLILFYVAKADTKRERSANLIVFGLSLFAGAGLSLYFLINDSKNLVYPLEQFDHIISEQRNAMTWYYDFYFYKHVPDYLPLDGMFIPQNSFGQNHTNLQNLIETVLNQIKTTLSYDQLSKFIFVNLIGLFLFVFLSYILFSYFKETKHPFKRLLTALFFILSLIITATGVFFSTDNIRWLGHSFILLFVFIFYLLYFDYRDGIPKIQMLFSKMGDWFVAVILFFYMCMIVDPYTFFA